MTHNKREKEDTELHLPQTPLPCTPSLSEKFPSPPTSASANFPDRPDPAGDHPPVVPKRWEVNRCAGCHRKVGLTGFRCRCGDMFCRDHRYTDRHDCSFDYKAAGREAIARENPVIRLAKILKV